MAGAAEPGPPFLRSLSSIGPRNRELTGAMDLLTHYGLQDTYDHFCMKPLPVSIADSLYLEHVVGDTEIRRGDGMEFQQLTAAAGADVVEWTGNMETLDLQLLQWAFTLREAGPIELLEADKGLETISGNVKDETDKKQHKKKHKKHKHREKDSKVKKKDKTEDTGKKGENDEQRSNKKHRKKKKKRKSEGAAEEEGDGGRKHKKKKLRHPAELT